MTKKEIENKILSNIEIISIQEIDKKLMNKYKDEYSEMFGDINSPETNDILNRIRTYVSENKYNFYYILVDFSLNENKMLNACFTKDIQNNMWFWGNINTNKIINIEEI